MQADGMLNAATLNSLKSLLTAASQNGLIVDVTFNFDTVPGLTADEYKAAISSTTQELALFRNVVFDLGNEYNQNGPSDGDVVSIFQSVRSADPNRLVSASLTGNDGTASGADAGAKGFAFVAYHDERDTNGTWSTAVTASTRIGNIRAALGTRVVPIDYQEPMPFSKAPSGCGGDISSLQDVAVVSAKTKGAASWTFHSRTSFELRGTSLSGRIGTGAEYQKMIASANAAASASWGASAFRVSPMAVSVSASAGSGQLSLTQLGSGSAWIASSDQSWLHIAASGSTLAPTYTWDANASTLPRTGTITIAGVPVTVTQSGTRSTADFNGDGDTDLLWQHASTGAIAVWTMNNGGETPTQIAGVSFNPQVPAPWRIVGSGDMNGDGQTDLVFQNDAGSTTSVAIWHMNGVNQIDGQPIAGAPVIPSAWKVRAVGDFNMDGKPDLVWQNADAGNLAVWFLNDYTFIDGVSLSPSVVSDTNWQIVGAGDANADGKPDLFWHHRTSGELAIWYMNGITQTAGVPINPPTVDPQWQVVGVGDFNRDGRPDLIWQDTLGNISTWRMNGAQQISGVAFAPPTPGDPQWRIVGPR